MSTPGIKRGIESPSAWKSPWFMTTLLPGSKFEVGGLSAAICSRSSRFHSSLSLGGCAVLSVDFLTDWEIVLPVDF